MSAPLLSFIFFLSFFFFSFRFFSFLFFPYFPLFLSSRAWDGRASPPVTIIMGPTCLIQRGRILLRLPRRRRPSRQVRGTSFYLSFIFLYIFFYFLSFVFFLFVSFRFFSFLTFLSFSLQGPGMGGQALLRRSSWVQRVALNATDDTAPGSTAGRQNRPRWWQAMRGARLQHP